MIWWWTALILPSLVRYYILSTRYHCANRDKERFLIIIPITAVFAAIDWAGQGAAEQPALLSVVGRLIILIDQIRGLLRFSGLSLPRSRPSVLVLSASLFSRHPIPYHTLPYLTVPTALPCSQVSPVVVPQLTTESAYILQPALTTLSLLRALLAKRVLLTLAGSSARTGLHCSIGAKLQQARLRGTPNHR
jgi:hypothetical protein